MTAAFELGLDTFGDITPDASGRKLTHAEALGNILEEAEPADECGIDFFGLGEHHRADFAISSPEAALWTDYKVVRDRIGIERGWSPVKRDEFVAEVERGSFYVGAPEAVARKTVATAKALRIVRFQMKYSAGPLPHERQMRSIELFGRKVAPIVREMLS